MNRFGRILVISAALAAVVAIVGPRVLVTRSAYAAEEPATATARLHIEGMTCAACSTAVKVVLKKIDGVRDANVSLEEKSAVVVYDPSKVTAQKLADTINEKLPYKATVEKEKER